MGAHADQCFGVEFSLGDQSGRGEKALCTETKGTATQFRFCRRSKDGRLWESGNRGVREFFPIGMPQGHAHLADMGDLLHRGENEGGQTFPMRLSHNAQTMAGQ